MSCAERWNARKARARTYQRDSTNVDNENETIIAGHIVSSFWCKSPECGGSKEKSKSCSFVIQIGLERIIDQR